MTTRESIAAYVLEAYAHAVRGSWADFDGRSAKANLMEVVKFLRKERFTLTPADLGVCIKGTLGPHWQYSSDCDVEEHDG